MPKGIPKSGKRRVSPHAGQLQRGHDPRRNVRGQVAAAMAGDAQARETMLDRIWGKVKR
jgi:predicted component of type VI protein secretion system